MSRQRVYLDHEASTPVLPEVVNAMQHYFSEKFGSPSSLHRDGLRVREAIQQARKQVAELVGATSHEEIYFTSNGTEAVNWALKGFAWANRHRGNHIIISSVEHPAVMGSVAFLERHGFEITKVQVDKEGFISLDEIEKAIRKETILIGTHLVNHDIGTRQLLAGGDFSKKLAERKIVFFCDAVAAAGWVPIEVEKIGCHLLSLSPHRFYGPKGVGVLYAQRGTKLEPLLHGGMQEQGKRAGMENVPAIVGAGVASEIARRDLSQRQSHVERLQKYLDEKISQTMSQVHLIGPKVGEKRAPHLLNYAAEGTEGEAQMLALDLQGIAVTSGTMCASREMRVSPVLKAIGLDLALAQGSIVLSLGKDNTREEIDYFVEVYGKIVKRFREMSLRRKN
ncbi:MAG: cysteine desulfurase [Verrucomicrobiae bacterium]|nr:cysteine desulfurase [Verrucomicrobiae bacterium]